MILIRTPRNSALGCALHVVVAHAAKMARGRRVRKAETIGTRNKEKENQNKKKQIIITDKQTEQANY